LRICFAGNTVATKNSEKQEKKNKNIALLNCKIHNLDCTVQFASLLVANWNTGLQLRHSKNSLEDPENATSSCFLPTKL
jgi:hypothetical protein